LVLVHIAHDFEKIATVILDELSKGLDLDRGKRACYSYITCIEKYFVYYFADKRLKELMQTDIVEFDLWRNRQMGKFPKVSTLNNFSSAWSKLCSVAVS